MVVYPNPTSDYLNVEIFSSASSESDHLGEKPVIETATLFDSNGNRVVDGKYADGRVILNVQGIRKGIYYLHVKIDNTVTKEQVLIE
jgi:hypothetical protein